MILIILTVLGLCFGSFVNALVWRLHQQGAGGEDIPAAKKRKKNKQQDLSIIQGRSVCVHCRHVLSVRDLIPVLSWLSLRGKCRYCHKKIAWQYPLVEAAAAALFVFSYVLWPYGFDGPGMVRFAVWLTMLVGFVALIVYDLRWMMLPNRIIYPLLSVVMAQISILSVVSGRGFGVFSEAVWGLIFSGGIFYILFQVSGGRWIGGGDVKLGFLLGLLVGGPANSLMMLFLASAIGTLVAVPLLLSGKATRDTRIPFGPFLIAAAIFVQLFGPPITSWYMRQLLLA